MRHIIFALIFGFSTAAFAQKPIELAPGAPDRHVVVAGDTLWGVAAKFLKDPFRWPDLWKMNAEQVKNPHRIYPGQVVVLDRSGSQPQLKLGNVVKLSPQTRAEKIQVEIPAIPPQAIEPFLARPLVIETGQFEKAPRIVALQDNRVLAGSGDTIYASGIDAKAGRWQVYQPGKPLVDPDSKETLGIEATHLGDARTVSLSAEVATLEVTGARQEISRGDYLLPAARAEMMSYVPRAPAGAVSGSVLRLHGSAGEGGRHSIVAISRGRQDGIEIGHVLALYRAGATVTNRFDDQPESAHVLPDERYGLVFVFRVFDRVAYGLVVEAARSVMPGDRVRQP